MADYNKRLQNSEQTSQHSTQRQQQQQQQQQDVHENLKQLHRILISEDNIKLSDIRPILNQLLICRYRFNLQPEETSEFQLDDLKELITKRNSKERFDDVNEETLLDSAKLRKYEEERRDREFREEVPFLEQLSEIYKHKYESVNQTWNSKRQRKWLKKLREKIESIIVGGDNTVATVLSQLEENLSSYRLYYSNWTSALRAFELLMSCSVREPENADSYLLRAVSLMNITTQSTQETLETIKRNKHSLETLRESHKLKTSILTFETNIIYLNESEWDRNDSFMEVFSNLVQAAMTQIASDVTQFIAMIIDQCIRLLGQDCPCQLSVIGIGSLARFETTSFSDVEFFFLIQDAAHREYFYRLANLMYFMIGSLAETNLKTLAIPELKSVDFFDEAAKGLRIDGLGKKAGNMPTGNGLCPDTELIFTLDQFLHEYKSALDNPKAENSRGVCSTIVDMTAHMTEIWNKSADETNLLEQLKSELSYIPRTEQAQSAITQLLISDIKTYNFLPDLSYHSGQRDVKVDFYRFISLLLSGINNLQNFNTENNWECINELKSRGLFNEHVATTFRFLLASSLYTRLAAYQHYNCQRDLITVLQLDQNCLSTPHTQYSVSGKLFMLTMSYLVPIKQQMLSALIEQTSIDPTIQSVEPRNGLFLNLTQDIFTGLIITHHYCRSYSKIINLFKQKFEADFLSQIDVTQLNEVQSKILYNSLYLTGLLTE